MQKVFKIFINISVFFMLLTFSCTKKENLSEGIIEQEKPSFTSNLSKGGVDLPEGVSVSSRGFLIFDSIKTLLLTRIL